MSDLTRPAFEAEAKAEGHRPKAEGQEAEATTTVLAANPKAAAILAKAEAARIRATAGIEAKDAEAVRKAKAELAQLEAELTKAEAKYARKTKAAERRTAARAKVASKAAGLLEKIRSESAASFSAFVYLVVVAVAVFSQRQIFLTQFQWGSLPSWGAAIFIELTGLAFYATSVSMRLDGRSGIIPRAIAWLVTGFAAFMQFKAHESTKVEGVPLLSFALAAASIAALLLAEIRTTHKVGKRLEAMDQKDRPQARLGLRFCLRFPAQAFWAISAMIAIPGIRTRSQALRAGRLIQTLRARRDLSLALQAEAERAAKAARKAGTSEAVLMRLEEWAHYGLDAIGLQAALASAPVAHAKAEAERKPIEAEADIERPQERPRPSYPRPSLKSAAQPRPKAIETGGEADEPAQSVPAEAETEDLDLVWAGRPGGLIVWMDRLAELALLYPASKAAGYPAEQRGVPSRATILKDTAAIREAGGKLRHTWTNKGHVTWAMTDLRKLRERGLPDPNPRIEADTPDSL